MNWAPVKKFIDSPVGRHAGLILLIMTVIFTMSDHFNTMGSQKAEDFLEGLPNVVNIKLSTTTDSLLFDASIDSVTQGKKERLVTQLGQVKKWAYHHKNVFTFLYGRYLMSIYMIMFSGLIAGLALIFVSKQGWENTNRYILNIFMIFSAAALYYTQFPVVFQQQENITGNQSAYMKYLALERDIKSYIVTGKTRIYLPESEEIKVKQLSLNDFILRVDTRMERLNKFYMGFDPTRISDYKALATSASGEQ